MILSRGVALKTVTLKPLVVGISTILLTACASTSNKTPKTGVTTVNSQTASSSNQALLDVNSTDELAGLLAAHNMDMVENSQADIMRMGNLWDRLRSGFQLTHNIGYNPRIEAQRSWFITRQTYLNRLTARASRYLYHTVREAEKRNIPTELALLPVIESSYDPSATSNAAAAGMWQFIPSTGKMYGLQVTSDYDGRRDVIESTRAAYDFLTDLYNQFGSWELALAAYNAGPGRVQKAIDRNASLGRGTDFWSLKLPKETMNYVPRFLAVADIVANPAIYNVNLPAIANKQHFRTVPAGSGVSLYQVSQLTGVSSTELQALNTGLVFGQVSGWSPQRVLIPNSVSNNVDAKISALAQSVQFVDSQTSAFVPTSSARITAVDTTPKLQVNQASNTPTYNSNPYDNSKLPTSSLELAKFAQNSQIANSATTFNVASSGASAINNTVSTFNEPPLSEAETQAIKGTGSLEPALTKQELASVLPEQEPQLNEQELAAISQQIAQEAKQEEAAKQEAAKQQIVDQQEEDVSILAEQAANETTNHAANKTPVDLAQVETQQTVLEAQGKAKELSFATEDNPLQAIEQPEQPKGERSTYTVQAGDTLSNIAKRAEVNWRDIAKWNQMEPNGNLLAGATLYLYDAKPIKPLQTNKPTEAAAQTEQNSAASKTETKTEQPKSKPESYLVKSGDTLIGTAAEFGLSASQLAKYNGLSVTDNLFIGQKLWLVDGKVKSTPKETETNTTKTNTTTKQAQNSTGKTQSYRVKSGDGLIALSKRFNVPVKTLAGLNGLSPTDNLLVGQNILIPAAQNKFASNTKSHTTSTSNKQATNASTASKENVDNKTVTSTYKIKSGDTLIGIAKKLGVSTADIAAVNKFSSSYRVQLGQTIKVPATSTSVALKLNNQPQKYKVQSGDTLLGLAGRFGVSASALAAANKLTVTSNLLKGSTLTIPAKGQTSSTQVAKTVTQSSTQPKVQNSTKTETAEDAKGKVPEIYVVESGDSLIGIANRFGTTLSKLAAFNEIKVDDGIRIGQKLKLPQPNNK